MTKILLSAIVTDMRNSTAGTTFSKNRYGNVMKKKQTPVRQSTVFQSYWRQAQAGIAKSWRSLTEIERQSWIDGASNFPYTDKFGNVSYLSGFALYQRLNLNLYLISSSLITSCPAPVSPPAMNDFVVIPTWNAVTNQYDILAFASSAESTVGYRYAIYATQPASAGKMVKGKTTYFVEHWNAPDEQADISGKFKLFFGTPQAGQKSFFEVFALHTLTGQRGTSLTYSVIFPAH